MDFKEYIRGIYFNYSHLMKIFELCVIALCLTMTQSVESCLIIKDLGSIQAIYKLFYFYIVFLLISLLLHANRSSLPLSVMVIVPLIGSACFYHVRRTLIAYVDALPYATQSILLQHSFLGMYTLQWGLYLLPCVYVALLIDAFIHFFGQPSGEQPEDYARWKEQIANWERILRTRGIPTREGMTFERSLRELE